MKYFAYELLTGGCSSDIWVDLDPAKMLIHLAEDLNIAAKDQQQIEEIYIGTVNASDPDEAMAQIRAGKWVKDKTYGRAKGCEDYSVNPIVA